uniref:F-box/LRR-repeat protein 15-like leucin rich repeat domain-containing protein n=1 Tax=Chenopodium quinoa TaxID=63459 RepID=A0A803LMZ4_CHEQI
MEMEEEESKELLDECWEMIFDRLQHKRDLNEAVVAIARSGLDLEELLALSDIHSQRALWLEELGSNMKNKALTFSGGQGDADLVRIADSFPNLEELCIDHEGVYTITVTDEGVDYMSSKLKRLRKIDLSNKAHISDKSLVLLSKNCQLLEHIKIYDYSTVTEEGISFLVNNSHHLNFLYICKGVKIDSFGVNGSSSFLPNLRSLRLQHVDISDEFLISLTEARMSLTDLALTDCESFTFTGISRLLLHTAQSLKSFELGGLRGVEFLTNEHIEYLSSFLQNLTSIKLFDCSNLSDSAFVMITQRCSHLCHFAMTDSSLGKEDYKYDGLMKKNQSVKYLDLSSHDEFRASVLKRLLYICPEVEKLRLRHCFFLRHDKLNVPDILEYNRRLVKLDITGSHHIKYLTENDLELEFYVLEKLVAKFSGINDRLLTKLGRICPRLVHLNLQDCGKVTEQGVKEVLILCKQLRYLSISCCEKVDFNIIPWIVTSRPSLRKLVSSSRNYPDDETQEHFLQQGCLVLKDSNYYFTEDVFRCNMLNLNMCVLL